LGGAACRPQFDLKLVTELDTEILVLRRLTERSILAGVLLASLPLCQAQSSTFHLSGSIAGYVRDVAGVPQMGAAVALFNRQERQIFQAITNERGVFGFDGLAPETYSIRVSLASFVPALKQKIVVQPGMQSLLYINMASLLSSVELVYALPGQGALMSEDWKGTLKAASAIRPVLRALPEWFPTPPVEKSTSSTSNLFADTRGVLKLSAGDPGSLGGAAESDYGTAFAVETSFLGRNQLQLSGDVGYGVRTGMPEAAFRTTWSREGLGPDVTITVHQLSLPIQPAAAVALGQTSGVPALRTISLATRDHLDLGDALHLEYGATLDSVSFLDHFNYFSPFARLTYQLDSWGTLRVAYSGGSQPDQVMMRDGQTNTQVEGSATYDPQLSHDLAALSIVPRVSLRDGRAQIQRTQNVELGYEKTVGLTRLQLSAFHENVTNGALTASSANSVFSAGEVLPDLSDRTSILNVGSYERYGYAASLQRRIGDRLEFGVATGRAGALSTSGAQFDTNTADELRGMLRSSQRFWASARAAATLPGTGTRISGSYQWNENGSLLPTHTNLTGNTYTDAGLNLHVSQPIPGFPGMPGRLEATADIQNLTAQGYLPVTTSDGQRILLMQAPRAVRGGLSFIF
jgi:Carboxypeptidase regulatory-like domain/TonB dependent receptor